MSEHHVAVRTADGQHIVSALVDVERVSDIGVIRDGDVVAVVTHGDVVASGTVPQRVARGEKLMLARWPVDKDTHLPIFDGDPVLRRV